MHEIILNELLWNSCSSPSEIEGYNEYRIELCCAAVLITAKYVGDGKFDIISSVPTRSTT